MISFVIPAFNEEGLVELCIQSIRKEARNLTYEIIVVDNGSTDETVMLANLAGATVVSAPRKGVTRARQAGFEASKYDIVAFVDADNEIPQGWLNCALLAIEPPNVVAASGPVSYFELSLPKRLVSFAFYCGAKVLHSIRPMVQGGNFILKKDALQRAGGFNTDLDFYGEDTDTAMRLAKTGKVVFSLDMWCYSSARRMNAEGMVRVGFTYVASYVWMWLSGKPWTKKYIDHRPD